MSNRKDGSNTARNDDGTFGPGNRGKPKGARHAITRAVEELLEGQAEVLTQKAVDRALEGDVTALRLCIDRIAPARKDAPVGFDQPSMQSAQVAAQAAEAVLSAVSDGEITPLEGAAVMGMVEQYRRTLELTEFEKPIDALEVRK